MKPYRFKIEIYSYDITFFMDSESYKKETGLDEYDFICSVSDQTVAILVSNKWNSATNPKYLQCLSHECNHAAMIILDRCFVKFDGDNQEPLCYLQDYIFRKCYEYSLKKIK